MKFYSKCLQRSGQKLASFMLESAKLRALRAIRAPVPHMPRALRALEPQVSRALRALMLHVHHTLHTLLLTTMICNLY